MPNRLQMFDELLGLAQERAVKYVMFRESSTLELVEQLFTVLVHISH